MKIIDILGAYQLLVTSGATYNAGRLYSSVAATPVIISVASTNDIFGRYLELTLQLRNLSAVTATYAITLTDTLTGYANSSVTVSGNITAGESLRVSLPYIAGAMKLTIDCSQLIVIDVGTLTMLESKDAWYPPEVPEFITPTAIPPMTTLGWNSLSASHQVSCPSGVAGQATYDISNLTEGVRVTLSSIGVATLALSSGIEYVFRGTLSIILPVSITSYDVLVDNALGASANVVSSSFDLAKIIYSPTVWGGTTARI